MAKAPIRLTTSQAANLFGVSEKTIRRALQDQELQYIVVRGVYKINFESALKWSQSRIKIKNKFNKDGIGQFVDKWKIKNKLYSPNPKTAEKINSKETDADKNEEINIQNENLSENKDQNS